MLCESRLLTLFLRYLKTFALKLPQYFDATVHPHADQKVQS